MKLGRADVALGIDVGGQRKGYHVVALDGARRLVGDICNPKSSEDIANIIARVKPRLVAIDAPAGWAETGKSRSTERELARAGIQSFYTPTREQAARAGAFYAWVFSGEKVHEAARRTHSAYAGTGSIWGHSIEVFPNATVRLLSGQRPPVGVSKSAWRRQVLSGQGVAENELPNLDYVDAALCALTGLYALDGDYQAFGKPSEGLLIAPAVG